MPRAAALVVSALLLGVTACSSTASPSTGGSAAPGTVAVVASTNVYGDLAKTVGGDAVSVTSIIDDPSKDPHEYTADARTQLALSKAQVVIENGAGYDDFVDTMLSATTRTQTVVDVANVSGYDQKPADGEFNEHLWYDFPTMIKLTERLRDEFATAAPGQADAIRANAAALTTKLQALEQTEAGIKAARTGTGVAITEPVPLYLLEASGLVDKTPEAFSEAVENDTDVPATVLEQTLHLFSTKQVALLAYNEQTTGPQTEAVLAAARQNGVAVVPVTETMPAGETYLSWMGKNLQAVSTALGGTS